jgi:hypothetical protein
MRLILTTAALSLAAAAAPAVAAERVSDSAYIAAVRCQAVLGQTADASLKSFLSEQRRGRHEYVQERAEDAKREGRKAAARQPEAAQACARFAAKPTVTASASSAVQP